MSGLESSLLSEDNVVLLVSSAQDLQPSVKGPSAPPSVRPSRVDYPLQVRRDPEPVEGIYIFFDQGTHWDAPGGAGESCSGVGCQDVSPGAEECT